MNKTIDLDSTYAVIGAGPSGLGQLRAFQKRGIKAICFEYHSEVGGIWNNDNPLSTMYNSAHLISSKTTTEFKEFPFKNEVADYPHNVVIKKYMRDYAENFSLKDMIQFNSAVLEVKPFDSKWMIKIRNTQTDEISEYLVAGVVIASGLFNKGKEKRIKFKGEESFKGEIVHAADYKSNDLFANKKVLIVGAGNSGCDIAVDAVHRAKKVGISVRRGYYFVPKYLFGKPADTVGGKLLKLLPTFISRKINKKVLSWFTGDPVRLGFPKPDYELFESHPIVNSLVLHHLGHGDLKVEPDIKELKDNGVIFKDGCFSEYDLILTATGYHLDFPYIDKTLLNWKDNCPDFYLNIFHPTFNNLFIIGMIEATGIGWQGRQNQAELVALYIKNKGTEKNSKIERERIENNTDLTAGMKYLKLARMAYYVNKDHYNHLINERIKELS